MPVDGHEPWKSSEHSMLLPYIASLRFLAAKLIYQLKHQKLSERVVVHFHLYTQIQNHTFSSGLEIP